MSKGIIEQEITKWAKNNVVLNEFFQKPQVRGLIDVCDYIVGNQPLYEKLISDFIAGFAYLASKDLGPTKDFNTLTKPVLDIVKRYLTSDDYRRSLIKEEVTGQEVLKINGVEIPISLEEILLQIKRSKENPLIPKDIGQISRDLVDYKNKQYGKALDEKPSEDYKEWLKFFIENTESRLKNHQQESQDKWQDLYDGLKDLNLIETNENFFQAMERYSLPKEKRILWIGSKLEGVYFSKEYHFSIPDFNKCFRHKSGLKFKAETIDSKGKYLKLKELIAANKR